MKPATLLTLLLAIGCGDGTMDTPTATDLAAATLPKCPYPVAANHYCPDGRVACWEFGQFVLRLCGPVLEGNLTREPVITFGCR